MEVEGGTKGARHLVSDEQVLRPCLKLPDVFDLLHHSNQVTPMLVLESVVGE